MSLYVLPYPCDTREILKRGTELVFHNEQNILLKKKFLLAVVHFFVSPDGFFFFISVLLYWCVNCPW